MNEFKDLTLSAIIYAAGVRHCWQLLESFGYTNANMTTPSVAYNYADNGCVHCCVKGYVDGRFIQAAVKLDVKPANENLGKRITLRDGRSYPIIAEQLCDDGWATLYTNPNY